MEAASTRKLSISWNTAVIVVLVAVLAAFLFGFVPQYDHVRQLNSELSSSHEQLSAAQWNLELAASRDRGSMLFVELNKKNYGNAAGLAADFFKQLNVAASHAPDAARKNALTSLAAKRDEIVAKVAKTDPAAEVSVRDMLEQLHKVR